MKSYNVTVQFVSNANNTRIGNSMVIPVFANSPAEAQNNAIAQANSKSYTQVLAPVGSYRAIMTGISEFNACAVTTNIPIGTVNLQPVVMTGTIPTVNRY